MKYKIKVVDKIIKPNFRLSKDLNISEEFRQYMNQWCDEFFGTSLVNAIEDHKFIKHKNQIFINKEDFNDLKKSNFCSLDL